MCDNFITPLISFTSKKTLSQSFFWNAIVSSTTSHLVQNSNWTRQAIILLHELAEDWELYVINCQNIRTNP